MNMLIIRIKKKKKFIAMCVGLYTLFKCIEKFYQEHPNR